MEKYLSLLIVGLIGGLNGMIVGFILLMAVDFVTGVLCALYHKSLKSKSGGLNSSVGFRGIIKKAAMIMCVIFGAQLDRMTGAGICRDVILAALSFNEGLSILENIGSMGIKLPAIIMSVLDKLQGGKGGKDDN